MTFKILKNLKKIDRFLMTILIIVFISSVGGSMIIPLFPIYVERLNFSGLEMSVLFSLFYVGRVAGGIISGKLYNYIGPKKLIIILLVLFFVSMIGYVTVKNMYAMFFLRFLQGIFSIGLIVFARTAFNQLTSVENRGLANGFLNSSSHAGMILGPVFGGTLSTLFSIEAPFYFVGLLALLAIIPSLTLKLQEDSSHDKEKVDSIPVKRIDQRLVIFSTIHLLKLSFLAIFINFFSIYANEYLGWTILETSIVFTIFGVSGIIASPVLGYVSDKLKDRVLMIIIGLSLIILEVLSFLLFSNNLIIYLGFFIGGIGGAAYFGSFFAQIGDITTPNERGPFTGKVLSLADIGSILAPIVAGYLMEVFNLQASFYFIIVLMLLAIGLLFYFRFSFSQPKKIVNISSTK
jgi:DHA1 family quinolone resistance protein-like MFS transporter